LLALAFLAVDADLDLLAARFAAEERAPLDLRDVAPPRALLDPRLPAALDPRLAVALDPRLPDALVCRAPPPFDLLPPPDLVVCRAISKYSRTE
jgi:hypothetical protein